MVGRQGAAAVVYPAGADLPLQRDKAVAFVDGVARNLADVQAFARGTVAGGTRLAGTIRLRVKEDLALLDREQSRVLEVIILHVTRGRLDVFVAGTRLPRGCDRQRCCQRNREQPYSQLSVQHHFSVTR